MFTSFHDTTYLDSYQFSYKEYLLFRPGFKDLAYSNERCETAICLSRSAKSDLHKALTLNFSISAKLSTGSLELLRTMAKLLKMPESMGKNALSQYNGLAIMKCVNLFWKLNKLHK